MNHLLFHHQKYLVNSCVLHGCFCNKFPYCNNSWCERNACAYANASNYSVGWCQGDFHLSSAAVCVLNVYSVINFRLVTCCWSVEVACPCLTHNRVYYTNSWRRWSTWLHVWIWAGWHYWYSIICVINGMTRFVWVLLYQ